MDKENGKENNPKNRTITVLIILIGMELVVGGAESRNIKAFTFVEFAKVGAFVTLVNISIYYVFITYL